MGVCRRTSFCDLKFKDVINICDGRRLGRVIDVIIDIPSGRVRGLVVPGERGFNLFRAPEDVFIAWRNILRIGEDVVLVEITLVKSKQSAAECKREKGGRGFKGGAIPVSAAVSEDEDDEDDDDDGDDGDSVKPRIMKYMDDE